MEPEDDLDLRLMRLLLGELPAAEAADLARRRDREPALAARYRRLQSTWAGLTPPAATPLPLGWSGRVMVRVRELAASAGPADAVNRFSWAAAPGWVRAAGAAALVAGLALGTGLGIRPGGLDEYGEHAGLPGEPALAESYWDLAGAPADDTAAGTADAATAARHPAALPSPSTPTAALASAGGDAPR
jgi:anti-sigma factor RsiW